MFLTDIFYVFIFIFQGVNRPNMVVILLPSITVHSPPCHAF